jgi:hypothetical protein
MKTYSLDLPEIRTGLITSVSLSDRTAIVDIDGCSYNIPTTVWEAGPGALQSGFEVRVLLAYSTATILAISEIL